MIKEQLKEQQPVVYHTLQNALRNDQLAHAYLFHGPSGTMKKEAAYLLAQSIVCRSNDFACETCDVCQRIIKNEYADMIYLDGTEFSIKKDQVIKLQHAFNKTGLESAGKKIYILDHAENATPDALNSLLKFLEEPTNDMVAIFIVEQIDRVLPTIVSRCQSIPFTALKASQCYQMVKEELNELDAYLLSHMIRQKSEIISASETDDYQHARFVFQGIIERWNISSYDALLFLQLEGFPSKQKKYGKVALSYVIDMLSIFLRDTMKDLIMIDDAWYQQHLQIFKKTCEINTKLLQILMRAKDMLLRSVNISLLIDQLIYQMKEVII